MMSNYLKEKIFNWVKSTAFPADPDNVWLAFFSDSVDAAGSGTEVSGIVNGGRKSVTWSTIQANTYIRNNQFSLANASGNTTVVSVGLYDASTGGNLLFFTNLTSPISITAGQGRLVVADSIRITLT